MQEGKTMSVQIPAEFIHRIPKTDLHVHLDGSLRIPTLIELAQQEGVELPAYDEAGLKKAVFKTHYANLPEYLQGFAYTCAVLQNAENLERVAYELGQDNIEEGVRYVEVRFAPQLHSHDHFSIAEVVRAVAKGMDRAKKEHNESDAVKMDKDIPFEYGIIVCALRSFNEHMSDYYRKILGLMSYARKKEVFAAASLEIARAAVALAQKEGIPVVGFDLAGEEAGYPAGDHRDAFIYAHKHFLRKTVHAGEAYGPESIFQAITDCHANRIGHGTFLFAEEMIQDPAIENPATYTRLLAEYIASQRVAIEVNLTSNLQTTPSIKSVADHPVKQMLDRNLSVSICTDNRLVSSTTVSNEFQILVNEVPITLQQFRNLVISGFKGSFYPGSYNEKRRYVRQVINRYEQLEREYLR
jgi:adenosine deaminase